MVDNEARAAITQLQKDLDEECAHSLALRSALLTLVNAVARNDLRDIPKEMDDAADLMRRSEYRVREQVAEKIENLSVEITNSLKRHRPGLFG